MPHYQYPLTLQINTKLVGTPNHPIEVNDNRGQPLFVAREKLKLFQANNFHVFPADKAGKNDPDQFHMLTLSGKGIDRGCTFMHTAKQRAIGTITQQRLKNLVRITICDEHDRVIVTVVDDVVQRARQVMSAFASGGKKAVLGTVAPLAFTDTSQAPYCALQAMDTHGGQLLSLSTTETSRENELRLILGVLTLMFWWQSDSSG